MSAKEMFEELGFEYEYNEEALEISVHDINNNWLWFYLVRRTFEYNEEIYIELLQAINKQVEELGWEDK